MLFRLLLAGLVLTGFGWPIVAASQTVVTSDGPAAVSVTIYRNPDRSSSDKMELNWVEGYALITEQRTVNIPAGEVDIRFRGVAGGIIPASAIVTGLPDGVVEKNRDAALLSPSALLNGYIGRRVMLRRTSQATGQVREYAADIRTGASGGLVIQTADGFEALRCTGLNEALVYPSVPEGLSDKPTLSVKSLVNEPTIATITLSYLATGFDWQANYVADVNNDGQTLNLFAWVTLANGDETSFQNAQTQTVAGEPNKEEDRTEYGFGGGGISFRCWPQATTSDVQLKRFEKARDRSAFLGRAMAAPMAAMEGDSENLVVVTGSRVTTQQEDLGDLKLYRIPVPVTVAAQSLKQVAMFEKSRVPFERIYEAEIWADDEADSEPMDIVLKFQNEKKDRLGLPLPAGVMVVFREQGNARLLLGEGSFGDKAIGQEVEVTISKSPLVRYEVGETEFVRNEDERYSEMELRVTNASSGIVQAEVAIDHADDEIIRKASKKLRQKNGKPIWKVKIPANSERILRYRVFRAQ